MVDKKLKKIDVIAFGFGLGSFLIYASLMIVIVTTLIGLSIPNYNPIFDKIRDIVFSAFLGLSIISFVLALVAFICASRAGFSTYFAKIGSIYGLFTIFIWTFLGFSFIVYACSMGLMIEEKSIMMAFYIILSTLSLAPLILHTRLRAKNRKAHKESSLAYDNRAYIVRRNVYLKIYRTIFKKQEIIGISVIIIILAILGALAHLFYGAFSTQRYSESVSYSNPNWLSNDRIVFVREIGRHSHRGGWFSDVPVLESAKFQICSMDTNGNDEKVIKEINVIHKLDFKRGLTYKYEKEDDRIFRFIIDYISHLAYHPIKNVIFFSAADDIFAMDIDGTNLRRIIKDGAAIDFSPDGNKVIYTPIKYTDYDRDTREFWVMDIETGQQFQLPKDTRKPIWHPNGDKIIYRVRQKDKDRKSYIYTINLDGTGKEEFFTANFPHDWPPDGSKFISYDSVYDVSSKTYLKLDNMPNQAFISPDGTKIVGYVKGGICILNIDGTDYKLLRKHHHTANNVNG